MLGCKADLIGALHKPQHSAAPGMHAVLTCTVPCRAAAAKQRLIERVRDRRAELDRLIAERRARLEKQRQKVRAHCLMNQDNGDGEDKNLGA